MLIVGEHEIENVVYYKKAKFNFDYQGLSVIYGHNTNAGDGSSNGAGKSLILRTVPRAFNIGMPVNEAKLRKPPLFRKGSRLKTQLRDDIASYTVEHFQKADTGATKTTLTVDGDDRKVRTQPLVEDQIAAIFPMSDEEFYTFVYLDSRRLAKFQLGTSAERFAFFTNLFQLNRFDHVREAVNKMIADAKDDKVRWETLSTQITELETSLKSRDVAKVSNRLKELGGLITGMKDRLKDGDRMEADLRLMNWDDLALVVKALRLTAVHELDAERLKVARANCQYNIEEAGTDIALIQEWERYEPKHQLWQGLMVPFKDYDPEPYRKQADHLRELETKLQAAQREWRSLGEVLPEEKPDLPGTRICRELVKELEGDVAEARATLTKLQQEAEEIDKLLEHGHDEGACVMCGTEGVSIQDYLNKKLDEIDAKRRAVQEKGRDAKVMASKVAKYLDFIEWQEKRDTIKKEVDALIDQVEPLQVLRKKYEEYLDAKNEEPAAPEEEKPEGDVESLRARRDKLTALRGAIDYLARTIEAVRSVVTKWGLSPDHEAIDRFVVKHNELKNELAELQTEQRQLDIQAGIIETEQEKLSRLTEQRDAINLEDAIILSEMYYCYSNKGLKNLYIAKLVERLEDRMNKWQHLAYREPMKFRFEVSENSFDILVTRGGDMESDIREMSGAESRAFSFLFPLACLPNVHTSRRCNIMILDEPEVNLDEVAKDLFLTQFLPQLRSIIPHVIIATPLKTEFPDARKFKAEKVGNVTTLQPL